MAVSATTLRVTRTISASVRLDTLASTANFPWMDAATTHADLTRYAGLMKAAINALASRLILTIAPIALVSTVAHVKNSPIASTVTAVKVTQVGTAKKETIRLLKLAAT